MMTGTAMIWTAMSRLVIWIIRNEVPVVLVKSQRHQFDRVVMKQDPVGDKGREQRYVMGHDVTDRRHARQANGQPFKVKGEV